ncbi:MAG: GNAT family N-acetyltransferase [Flavobacterium sp.]
MILEVQFYSFDELDTPLLYDLLKLRSEVFVVEQQCIYLDLDGKDKDAIHLIATQSNEIVYYARIFEKGKYYQDYVSIGRVIVNEKYRKEKFGDELMSKSLEYILAKWGNVPVKIAAQEHLEKFYNQHGFKKIEERFLEDGIWHIYMVKK